MDRSILNVILSAGERAHLAQIRAENRPSFPERLDLPRLTDNEAAAALRLARLLLDRGEIDLYTAAGGPRADGRHLWNVWLEKERQRIPLREWAARCFCQLCPPDDAA
jgi:hypothetical protein